MTSSIKWLIIGQYTFYHWSFYMYTGLSLDICIVWRYFLIGTTSWFVHFLNIQNLWPKIGDWLCPLLKAGSWTMYVLVGVESSAVLSSFKLSDRCILVLNSFFSIKLRVKRDNNLVIALRIALRIKTWSNKTGINFMVFIIRIMKNFQYYDVIHNFSLWLVTSSNEANINWFLTHTGN